MEIELVPAREPDRAVLRRILALYSYDISELNGADVDQHGEFGYRYLDHYWTENDRAAFLLRVDGHWAGFALVRRTAQFDMAEFFVMRKYRRRGIGRKAAIDLFQRFPGPWQVRQQQTNPLWDQLLALRHPVPVQGAAHIRGGRPGVRFGTLTSVAPIACSIRPENGRVLRRYDAQSPA